MGSVFAEGPIGFAECSSLTPNDKEAISDIDRHQNKTDSVKNVGGKGCAANSDTTSHTESLVPKKGDARPEKDPQDGADLELKLRNRHDGDDADEHICVQVFDYFIHGDSFSPYHRRADLTIIDACDDNSTRIGIGLIPPK